MTVIAFKRIKHSLQKNKKKQVETKYKKVDNLENKDLISLLQILRTRMPSIQPGEDF